MAKARRTSQEGTAKKRDSSSQRPIPKFHREAYKLGMAKTLKEPSARKSASDSDESVNREARELEELAYLLWQQRGCPEGSPEEDWFAAQRMLQARKAGEARPKVLTAGHSATGV